MAEGAPIFRRGKITGETVTDSYFYEGCLIWGIRGEDVELAVFAWTPCGLLGPFPDYADAEGAVDLCTRGEPFDLAFKLPCSRAVKESLNRILNEPSPSERAAELAHVVRGIFSTDHVAGDLRVFIIRIGDSKTYVVMNSAGKVLASSLNWDEILVALFSLWEEEKKPPGFT